MRRRIKKRGGGKMLNLTDEVSNEIVGKAERLAPHLIRAVPGMVKGTGTAIKAVASVPVAGIALVFKASKFTSKTIMQATGQMLQNPKYYKNNISISELEKNSDIRQVDVNLTKNEMRYFEKSCKKFGVKYNAVVDKSNPKEPTYYVFFRGKESAVIEKAMKETYEMFLKEQAKPKLSVRAKLAFFHERVKERDAKQQDIGKEKHHNKSEQQR